MNVESSPQAFFEEFSISLPSEYLTSVGKKHMNVPTECWIVQGVGESNHSPLNAFDNALVDAGIGHLNLITYSSIIPKFITYRSDLVDIHPGSETGIIIANASGSLGDTVSAGISIAPLANYFLVYESHSQSNAEKTRELLVASTQEAMQSRGEHRDTIYIQTVEKTISKKFGHAFVAIVFNPKTYL